MVERPESSAPLNTRWRDLIESGYLGRLVLLCFGVWLHAADSLMVATIIPSVVGDIGGARLIAWTFALYEVGSIVAGAAGALLSLRYGLRASMICAALVYLVGCLMSAASPNMPAMLAGRLAQGLGGGGLVALSFISVVRLFPREFAARAMAAMSLVWGVSAFTGPLVGGVFADLGYWRGAFLFFALQALLLSLWMFIALRETVHAPPTVTVNRIPLRRLGLLCSSVIAIASAGINVSFYKSSLLILVGGFLLWLFLRLDARREHNRLLPIRPFDPRHRVGAALLMMFCFTASTIAISVYGPILMTIIFGASALAAGYIIALSSIGWSTLAVLTANAPERRDSALIVTGMCVLTISMLGFVYAVPNGPLALIALFAFLEGAGFGMAYSFILRRVTHGCAETERDRIASALPTVQRFGYAVGAAYVGIVANAVGFSDALVPDMAKTAGFWIFALCLPFAAVGMMACVAFVRR